MIGLNLCPFAKAVHTKKQIRFVASPASQPEELLHDLIVELKTLAAADPQSIDTTLLIHPETLQDFLDYNDFLDSAEAAIVELNLEDDIQIASFHPQYQFKGTKPDDITNYTNRSPYPMLHLLRNSSLDKAVETYPNVEEIPQKNIETLQKLGLEGWNRLFPNRN